MSALKLQGHRMLVFLHAKGFHNNMAKTFLSNLRGVLKQYFCTV